MVNASPHTQPIAFFVVHIKRARDALHVEMQTHKHTHIVIAGDSRRFHPLSLPLCLWCPRRSQCLQIFTNGIVWWGQDPFKGDQFAGDVVRICKHLRSVFRWHCLETLPLWVWSGKDEKDPPPPDPAPSTEEEWEAEVGEGRLFAGERLGLGGGGGGAKSVQYFSVNARRIILFSPSTSACGVAHCTVRKAINFRR